MCILCNEEGDLIGLKPNRRFCNDNICGVFYLTGQDYENGHLKSLPENLVKYYSELFTISDVISPSEVDAAMISQVFFYESRSQLIRFNDLFVIGGYNFKELISNKKVYIASLLRLVVIPAVILLILTAIGTSKEIMTLALVAFGTSLGLNTIVYPAAYGGDTKTGAVMTMISHTLSVVTIPLMYLIFIVYL